MVTKLWEKVSHKCRDSGKFSQWTSEWARAGSETCVPGMRKQWGFLWQSKHNPKLRRLKACDLWARTGATGKQNEFVSTSRILYFYSHDRIGPYSFFNLGETVQLIQLTLECSLEWVPQQASHCPCWPFGWAKQRQFSCYALCTHPVPQ